MENVKAVTFDVGGTLIEPWPSVGHAYAEVAQRHGVEVEPDVVTGQFVKAWQARGDFAYTKDAWATIVDQSFAGLTTMLPSQTFFDELYDEFATAKPWFMYPDVIASLAALKKRKIRMAVISNWDDRLRVLLESLELAHEFEVIIVSAEVGFTKPSPKIFQAAVEALQLPPTQILHVGDSEKEDHHGAQAAGFQSRWLCRGAAEPIGNCITSLNDLTQ